MIGQSIRQSLRSNALLFQVIAVFGFGLLSGLAILWLSPFLVLGVMLAILFVYATIKRPEIGLLGILVATSSIVYEERLPLISLGGASLVLPDLLLLGLFGLIAARWLVEPGFKIVRTPLDWPLLIFYGVTMLSTLVAISQSSVEVEPARKAIRVLTYYLIFFAVTNLVRERRQLDFLLKGVFLLATVVATAMVAQFLLGDSIRLVPGRVESLSTRGIVFDDITRILPPGWPVILVSFVVILCILVVEKPNLRGTLRFLQFGLLGLALLLTFLRSYWTALLMVFFLLGLMLRGHDRQRLIRWGVVAVFVVAVILALTSRFPGSRAERFVGATVDRVRTLVSSVTLQGPDSSLDWRMIENGYALSTIASHPVIGLGMGAAYRPWDPRLDRAIVGGDFRKHIHNGHLWILLQSGLLGYLSLMWLSLVFLKRGFGSWRSVVDDRLRGVVLGFTLAYLAVLIAAVVNSTFMQWRWAPVIGLIMGVNEVILRSGATKNRIPRQQNLACAEDSSLPLIAQNDL